MVITTLFAMNELTNSVSSSVNAILMFPGEQFVRKFNIPDSSSWNHIRVVWKDALVGSNFSESITGFKWFAGICSDNRGYKVAGAAHCIGASVVSDPSASGSVTLTRVTTGNSIPTGSTIAWSGTQWAQTVITGSFLGASGTTIFFPRYDTEYSALHTSASLVGYPWRISGIDIIKGGTNVYTCSIVTWRDAGNTATGSQFNIPAGVFRSGLQAETTADGGGNASAPASFGAASPYVLWSKWFIENTMSINMAQATVVNPRNMLEDTLGILDNLNFYWTCSNPGVRLAIRDIHVIKIR